MESLFGIDNPCESTVSSLLIVGNALAALKKLPDGIADCCVTSPPYWGVRDYDIRGQIGIEPSLSSYLTKLCKVFSEVNRVLRPEGTLWLNIGDTYTSGNRGWRAPDNRNKAREMYKRPPNPPGLKDKELVGVPWRLAFKLQKQGWFLRSNIVWSKPNAQPESVKDRPSRSHEDLFLLSKSKIYYYDQSTITEERTDGNGSRNKRSVWTVPTANNGTNHSESFPLDLVRPCILSGSRSGGLVVDPFSGSGTVGLVCQQESRQFLGIDLLPRFVEVARQRLGLEPNAAVRVSQLSRIIR